MFSFSVVESMSFVSVGSSFLALVLGKYEHICRIDRYSSHVFLLVQFICSNKYLGFGAQSKINVVCIFFIKTFSIRYSS